MTEAELKQLVIGKELYLRGGYLENSLSFDEHGRALGHPKQGSYTLCAIQIERAHLTKHKVELEGTRYGLHFVGQLAYEDSSKAVDRVRITPKKKVVKITIDREIVVKPKKVKAPKAVGKGGKEKDNKGKEAAKGAAPAAKPVDAKTAPSETPVERAKVSDAKPAPPETPAEAPKAQLAPPQVDEKDEPELTPEEQLKASIAAAPEAERPADPKSVTTTISPAHAAQVLKDALDQIFAKGLDERMLASMPDFWKHYYEAAAAKVDYRPKDPSIYRQGMVDQKARLLTKFEPDSNEFAQANGVAGMAQYHTVVGPDGKVGEVAISRPIGFGLDESAVEAIRKASFEPAIKDGKPVAVMLELNVPFRIFSHRTEVHATPEPDSKPAETILPGPYSVLR
jgi:TonB family protein